MQVMSESLKLYKSQIKIALVDLQENKFKEQSFDVRSVNLVFFEDEGILGYFRTLGYFRKDMLGRPIVGINKSLSHKPFQHTVSVLEHELAHWINDLKNPFEKDSHGAEYKAICKEFDIDGRAKASIESTWAESPSEGMKSVNRVVDKVKKLLSLASSQNQNESEVAAQKANDILAKHNLENMDNSQGSDELIYMDTLLEVKKKSFKYKIISVILETYNVYALWNSARDYSHKGRKRSYIFMLEVSGDKANVEVAKRVFSFLDQELDRLFELSGAADKKSFFAGIRAGYLEKLKKSRSESGRAKENALVEYKKKIALKAKRDFYSNISISSTSSKSRIDSNSYNKGMDSGKKLSIKSKLSSTSSQSSKLLAA